MIDTENEMLSKRILCKSQKRNNFYKTVKNFISAPSVSSIVAIILLIVVLSCFVKYGLENWLSSKLIKNAHEFLFYKFTDELFDNLIIGLGAVIVGLTIFISELMKDNESADISLIWFEESNIYYLTVGFLSLLLLGQLGFMPYSVRAVLLILVLFLFFFALCNVFKIFRDKNYLYKKREKMLLDKVKKITSYAFIEKEGKEYLLTFLNHDRENNGVYLKYDYISEEESDDYHHFFAKNKGTIIDINLFKLAEFSNLLEEYANEKGYSFYEKLKSSLATEKKDNDIRVTDDYFLKSNKRRVIKKLFMDSLSFDEPIISVDKKLLTQKQYEKLKTLVKSIFIISDMNNIHDELDLEMSCLNNEFIFAINNLHINKIKSFSDLYLNLCRCFMEKMSNEESNIVNLFIKKIEFIFKHSLTIKNIDVIIQVSYLPVSIARIAIEKNNVFVFKQFIELNNYLYLYALEEKSTIIKNFLLDRSFRYLTETIYGINPNNVEFYSIILRFNLQYLIKKSFEEKDLNSFNKFIRAVVEVPSKYDVFYSEEIEKKREQVLYGTASFILDDIKKNVSHMDVVYLLKINKLIRDDFDQILLTLNDCMQYENYWGWGFWILGDLIGATVSTDNFIYYLRKFCIIKLLMLSDFPKVDEYKNYIFDNEGQIQALIETCKVVDGSRDDWTFILGNEMFDNISKLIWIFEKMKINLKQNQHTVLLTTKLSENKVNKFKQDLIENFYKAASVRALYKKYDLIEFKLNQNNPEVPQYGYAIISDRGGFIDNYHISYGDQGYEYGKNLGLSENGYLLNDIKDKCIVRSIEEIDTIINSSPNEYIILLHGVSFFKFQKILEEINKISNLKEDQSREFHGFYGFLNKKAPIVSIHSYSNDSKDIFVLNIKNLGKLVQYAPQSSLDNTNIALKDILYIDVLDLLTNSSELDKLTASPPEWLSEKGDIEAQRTHLQTQVRICIWEKFRWEGLAFNDGYVINCEEDEL